MEKPLSKKTILFVCFGNVHRSVLAAELSNDVFRENSLSDIFVAISRGIQGSNGYDGPKHSNLTEYEIEWQLTKQALDELGIDTTFFKTKKATPIDTKAISDASLVILMGQKEYEILTKRYPTQSHKFFLFSDWSKTGTVEDLVDSNVLEKHRIVNSNIVSGIKKNLIKNLNKYYERCLN